MKIKYYAAVACIILHCIPSFGQRQQTTEAFNPFANGLPTTTQKTYSYIIGEDGKKLKDGTFAISGKPDVVVTTKNHTRYSVNNNGYYKLKTTFSKGKLHGAFTFSYSVTCTLQGLAGNGSESQSMTFNGEFSNGKPHGSFNIQYRTESNEKLVASYDNGVLVGSFSSNGYYKDVPCAVKGTLTPKGELTGKWVIDNKDTSFKEGIYEFQNGVLIRKTIDEWATIPAVTELSKKYAAGAITEKELSEQGIIVLEDSIPLGKYANNIIFNNDVLDLEMALGGGYDFSTLNNKRYKYLKEVSMFNEKGFEFYTQMLEENLNVGTFDSYIKNHDNYKWGVIRIEDEGLVVVDAYLDVCAPYINAKGLKEYDFETDIYLSKEQEKIWKEMRLEAKEQFAITFGTAVAKSRWLDHNLAEYFLHEDQTFSYHTYEEMRKEAVKRTNNNGVSEMLKYFMLVPDNHDYIVEKDDYGRGYHIFRCGDFIKKASLERDTIMIYLLADKYDELVKGKSEEEKIKIEELKKELDAKLVNDFKKQVEPILEKMLNQSSTSIAYGEDAEEYFSPENLPADYWRLEFSKKLKPFGKIIGYEIVDFHGEYYDEVECIITTSSKKKVQNKYKVIWKLDRREGRGVRIIANSIDINNAIPVTAVNEK